MLNIKFGSVASINESEHKISLRELDTNLVGPEFPVLCLGGGPGKSYNLPAEGEPICCLMLGDHLGIVLGTYWTANDTIPSDSDDMYFVRIDANTYFKINTSTNEVEMKSSGTVKINSEVELGVSPTSPAMLYDPFVTWATDLLTYLGTGSTVSGPVTFAGSYPSTSAIESQYVKVK